MPGRCTDEPGLTGWPPSSHCLGLSYSRINLQATQPPPYMSWWCENVATRGHAWSTEPGEKLCSSHPREWSLGSSWITPPIANRVVDLKSAPTEPPQRSHIPAPPGGRDGWRGATCMTISWRKCWSNPTPRCPGLCRLNTSPLSTTNPWLQHWKHPHFAVSWTEKGGQKMMPVVWEPGHSAPDPGVKLLI